jgi:hypothetical protein
MSFYLYWVLWLAVGFLVVELIAALDRKPGGTLSEWVWTVFIWPRRYAFLKRFVFGAFWAALTLHFFFGESVVPIIVFGAGVGWAIWDWWKGR